MVQFDSTINLILYYWTHGVTFSAIIYFMVVLSGAAIRILPFDKWFDLGA